MNIDIVTAIITVVGTLIVTIIGALGLYILQNKGYEREKKRERESEQIRIKRELLSKRLDVVEEVVYTRMYLASLTMREEFGDKIYANTKMIQEKKKKLEEISNQAWTYIKAIGSKELKKWYRAIGSAYRQSDEQGTIPSEDWKEANSCFTKIIKRIDDMKARIE